ncbi:hypothetical protein Cgig2_005091 [Carnegiea gigantea]|uniref:Uncharacterized protein n=1 Tax=Carnegiea gigantea TaxID=171969 RepID=A0A9Q1L160_9CARY|nr:hypothetical protein Cgig2_005091 [Carnegiea gigantea]
MGWCSLSPTIPSSLLYINSTRSLRTLHLNGNHFGFSVFHWLFNLSRINTHLVDVDLSYNQLKGPIPDLFSNLKHLAFLDLSWNNLQGRLLEKLRDLCSLQVLSLGGNNLTKKFNSIVQTLSRCEHMELQALDLSSNALWGSLSDSGIFSRLSLLRQLDLSWNKLDGAISEDIRQLSKLEYLDLSCNSLEGEVSPGHFAGLSRLQHLSLANNHDLVLNFSRNWIPPFQLDTINLRSCILGPQFPKWLQSQTNFTYLDISNSSISNSVPVLFWSLLQPNLVYLNMSHNNISGTLPDTPINFAFFPLIDLSSNSLERAAPVFQGNVRALILSNNMFQNVVPLLCPTTHLMYLKAIELSNNLLSGELHSDCWIYMDRLEILHLENNNLSGRLPSFYGLENLKSLHLRNNSFSGGLPSSLKYCRSIVLLDLWFNSLSGCISPELENNFPSSLLVLSLQGNNFLGSIPLSLCQLSSLQILGLSFNNLSGAIPKGINCLLGMTETPDGNRTSQGSLSIDYDYTYGGIFYSVEYINTKTDAASLVWKGTEISHMKKLRLVKMIDISSNAIEGDIPDTISFLTGLVSLNLSRNNLTGSITKKIGRLSSLESLDLSSNQLSGQIPESLSSLSFLGVLDLSNNNLSGEIPSGTQLRGFDPSTYVGNPELYGRPLPRKCSRGQTPVDSPTEKSFEQKDDDDDSDVFPWLYISIVLGFVTGFWGICGTLMLGYRSRL